VYILLFVAVSPYASGCVCTSLRMASRVVTRRYDRALARAGLSAASYSILARLHAEGELALGELAARLALDRTTLSRELRPLVDGGLVRLGGDPADRRRRIVALSDDGARAVARARPLWAEAQAELAEEFGLDRADALRAELHALVGAA
jgi:DNA-binding MarR family transcriptional regulator